MKILYFSSPSCVPCRSVSPHIPTLAHAWGVDAEMCDVERDTPLTRRYRITSIPATLLIADSGDEMSRVVGTDMAGVAALFRLAARGKS